jgi:hypothetical protein
MRPRGVNRYHAQVEGDMRTTRLGRQFDAVFVHDAVCYMTTEADPDPDPEEDATGSLT